MPVEQVSEAEGQTTPTMGRCWSYPTGTGEPREGFELGSDKIPLSVI